MKIFCMLLSFIASMCLLINGCGGGTHTNKVAAISITTATLPAGTAGTAYSQILAATGGTSPYTWSVSAGALPTGLTLSTAGVISGTPTAAGTSAITFMVTDQTAATATQALSITVNVAALDGAALYVTNCFRR